LGLIQIQADAIGFDNALYFNFKLKESIKVYHIFSDKANSGISTLYKQEGYDYQSATERNIDLEKSLAADLLILDEVEHLSTGHLAAIKDFVANGGTLILIPNASPLASNALLNMLGKNALIPASIDSLRVGKLELEHPVFHQVFESEVDKPIYPFFKRFYQSNFTDEKIISLEDGSVLLGNYRYEKGQVFQFFAPINTGNSDFIKNNICVPVFINIAFLAQEQHKLFYTLGQDQLVQIDPIDAITVNLRNNEFDFIAEQNNQHISIPTELKIAGHYDLIDKDRKFDALSFNYNRTESDLSFWNTDQIQTLIDHQLANNWSLIDLEFDQIEANIKLQNEGINYWKLCVIFALGFLLIETLLMRIFN
jgi:hypothetical protein